MTLLPSTLIAAFLSFYTCAGIAASVEQHSSNWPENLYLSSTAVMLLLCFFGLLRLNREIKARHRSEADFSQLQQNLSIGFALHQVIRNSEGKMVDFRYLEINSAFERMTGIRRRHLREQRPRQHSGTGEPDWLRYFSAVEACDRAKHFEIHLRQTNRWLLTDCYQAADNRFVVLLQDISQSKLQHNELLIQVNYDALTQLPNRNLFSDRFSQVIAHSKRRNELLAVCYLDLDHFKQVNERFGHDSGDQLLMEAAKRIKLNLDDGDTACRLNGDQFALLLANLKSPQQGEETLKRIHRALAEPFQINDVALSITASSGATLYPLDNHELDILLRHAEQAMDNAKQSGRNTYRFHQAHSSIQLYSKSVDFGCRQDSQHEIQKALQQSQFCLYYQPKVNLRSGQVIGAEALLRWRHPKRGLLRPHEFLPLVEGSPLEIDLGIWLFREAFQQLHDWQEQGCQLQISINVSPRFLQWPDFLSLLDKTLRDYPQVSSRRLELEVLENSVLEDMESVAAVLNTCFYQFGVACALDDFGTGYSSLMHLRHLPINTVKIDQSFVRNMIANPDDQAIVESVIGLAKAFKRKVIAEGVETLDAGIFLINLGCDLAQGHAIAEAMPARQLLDWSRKYRHPAVWKQQSASRQNNLQRQLQMLQIQQQHWLKQIQAAWQSSKRDAAWPILIPKKTQLGRWLLTYQLHNNLDAASLQQLQHCLIQQCKQASLLQKHLRQQAGSDAASVFAQLKQTCEQTAKLLKQLETKLVV